MIIQDNFRSKFYEVIKKEHILIVVNMDVDALCAAVILMHILSCDEITYSLYPVSSFDELKNAIFIHGKQARNIILINSVGLNSLHGVDFSENINFWIIESRRPIHLDNIYSENSLKVMIHSSDLMEWQIPEASVIYEQEEESDLDDITDIDESAGDDGDEFANGTPTRNNKSREELTDIIGRRALKRQQKAKWRRIRGGILWDYYMKSWYGTPVSVFMLELAHELGKSNAEMMWCAAVGISSQYIDQLISLEKYTEICMDQMQPFIRKFAPRAGISTEQTKNQLRISFNKELVLPLYSHWTLHESMSNEPTFLCQSKLWSQRGEDKFKEILSELGLTLAECNQNFEVMKRERRSEVIDILMKHMDTGFASFTSYLGYNATYNSVDFARLLSLQLEYRPPEKKIVYLNENIKNNDEFSCRFESAHTILREFFKTGGREMVTLSRSLDRYKLALRSLNNLVKRSIVQNHVVLTPRYFLLTLSEQCPALDYFSSRHFLFLFTYSMLRAFGMQKSSRRNKPFIVAFPLEEENSGWYLITGLMPLSEFVTDSSRKSIIGSAFKHVAKESNMVIRHTFEPNVILIKSQDRFRFFDNLEARLELII